MPTVITHDGTPVQMPDSGTLWSNTGGAFTGTHGELTYFPMPGLCSQALRTVGYYNIPPHYVNRADLIAKELYGSEDYWWLIMWASKLLDPFQLVAGTRIRVVDLTEVQAAVGR